MHKCDKCGQYRDCISSGDDMLCAECKRVEMGLTTCVLCGKDYVASYGHCGECQE